MINALVLTLGHGSSAIFIQDNKVINGYQLERLTGIKGDSRFPALCIEEIKKFDTIPEDVEIYVSHWHPTGVLSEMSGRHWDLNYIKRTFPKAGIISTGEAMSHHDTHAYSARAYNPEIKQGDYIIVADGFGTHGEVLSIYCLNRRGNLHICDRVFGYDNSIGLLYQYATDYVGLKMNQDEYKLNAMANQVDDNQVEQITDFAKEYLAEMIQSHETTKYGGEDDPMYNLGALSHTHKKVVDDLAKWFKPEDKAEIALFLQIVVKGVVLHWIETYKMFDVTLVGGCFLNVQLNGEILDHIDGNICVMPLSGDEGAGLGLYGYEHPDFRIPNDLAWGKRTLEQFEGSSVIYACNELDFIYLVKEYIDQDFIVNVVTGNMEFGPRAYCNTSTLAHPTVENREYINEVNGRHRAMPMCPVMCKRNLNDMFWVNRVVRSVEHMIIALKCTSLGKLIPGATYTKPDGVITARPQAIGEEHWLYSLINKIGPLINTSFNSHGKPICYDMKSVMEAHKSMRRKDLDHKVVTIVNLESSSQKLSISSLTVKK